MKILCVKVGMIQIFIKRLYFNFTLNRTYPTPTWTCNRFGCFITCRTTTERHDFCSPQFWKNCISEFTIGRSFFPISCYSTLMGALYSTPFFIVLLVAKLHLWATAHIDPISNKFSWKPHQPHSLCLWKPSFKKVFIHIHEFKLSILVYLLEYILRN